MYVGMGILSGGDWTWCIKYLERVFDSILKSIYRE